MEAHRNDFDENMFLDPAPRTFSEKTGGANFLFVTKKAEIVTPKSPSITQRSLIYVAEYYLSLCDLLPQRNGGNGGSDKEAV